MHPLNKLLRTGLAAMLLCALSLFGGMQARGLAGLLDKGAALVHEHDGADGARFAHADAVLQHAVPVSGPALHKAEGGGNSAGHAPHGAAVLGRSLLASAAAENAVKLQALSRRADFTLMQRLALYPHHGFW